MGDEQDLLPSMCPNEGCKVQQSANCLQHTVGMVYPRGHLGPTDLGQRIQVLLAGVALQEWKQLQQDGRPHRPLRLAVLHVGYGCAAACGTPSDRGRAVWLGSGRGERALVLHGHSVWVGALILLFHGFSNKLLVMMVFPGCEGCACKVGLYHRESNRAAPDRGEGGGIK